MELKTFPAKIGKIHLVSAALEGTGALLGLGMWIAQGNLVGALLFFLAGGLCVVTAAKVFYTCYTFQINRLEARNGFTTFRIPYGEIETVGTRSGVVEGFVPMAMDKEFICIYFHQRENRYRLEISPADQKGFLEELLCRAPQIGN